MTCKKLALPLFALSVLMASCVMPTKYEAVLTVGKDTCELEYKGLFQVYEGLEKDVTESEAKDATRDGMKQLEAEVLQAGGSIKTSFARNGFFDAVVTLKADITETPKTVLYLVTVQRDGQGRVTVKTFDATEEDRLDFSRHGLEGKGELRVKTSGKVLECNAPSKPGIFSRQYGWKLDIMKGEPASMAIQF